MKGRKRRYEIEVKIKKKKLKGILNIDQRMLNFEVELCQFW
jgi:hypothetical protein